MPESMYKDRLRIRVNGLLFDDDALLMVKLHSPVTDSTIWMPPGGGLQFGETMEACLIREFREETGLEVQLGKLRHINELLEPPFHAVEFYFKVTSIGGKLELGGDPEHDTKNQLLKELRFIPFTDFDCYPIMPKYLCTKFLNEMQSGQHTISFSGK